ncbi:MAG: DNA mismatch repair protein MutS [Chloroflexi bacterium]|nr:DNA mismatch repair protein MutS [Chloroflexota bacterium]
MSSKMTPAWEQYVNIKKDYADVVLLFRMGDFYEAFDKDAHVLSEKLEITLTQKQFGKNQKHDLAGFPYHSLSQHLSTLLKKDVKVAICEQTSEQTNIKGIIEREVVRVVSPGTIFEDYMLDNQSNNYLTSLYFSNNIIGISYIDVSTNEIKVSKLSTQSLSSEISRLNPAELIINNRDGIDLVEHSSKMILPEDDFEDFIFESNVVQSLNKLSEQEWFYSNNVEKKAFVGLLNYLYKNKLLTNINFENTEYYQFSDFMFIDPQTRKNLSLFSSNSNSFSLFNTINSTQTSMGARLLKHYIGQPLINKNKILFRQEIVDWFFENNLVTNEFRSQITEISDIERLISKISNFNSEPRDVISLSKSIKTLIHSTQFLSQNNVSDNIKGLIDELPDISDVSLLIEKTFNIDYSGKLGDGDLIKKGVSKKLDEYLYSLKNSKQILSELEQREKEKTKIKNLKIRFNKIFGYYFEVTKSQIENVPDYFIRKQTLVNAERFFTEELKELETKITLSVDLVSELEREIYNEVNEFIISKSSLVLKSSEIISKLDVFSNFAAISKQNNYIKPIINDSKNLQINNSRHPMVEKIIESGKFVPNDVFIDDLSEQIILLTGPNMSGKSTYIRQIGILVLMAQIGCYISASSAEIGIVDRIFTRVGLEDDLSEGRSTFMTEMLETSLILNEASDRSLIILDEIGRGTSTYDGLAIAMSVAEYIHESNHLKSRTLFATHFHEMTSLESDFKRIKNYYVSVVEDGDKVVFLHDIKRGISERSFGIYVAELAGLPTEVIQKSKLLLSNLESKSDFSFENIPEQLPLNLIENNYEDIKNLINSIDTDGITPLDALIKLSEIKDKFKEK